MARGHGSDAGVPQTSNVTARVERRTIRDVLSERLRGAIAENPCVGAMLKHGDVLHQALRTHDLVRTAIVILRAMATGA